MLQSLRVRNFQAHEDISIDFDSSIISIVGRSDSGKSSIVRALRWLAFNRPAGDQFIRWGSKEASVELKVDGKTIARRRGHGCNVYTLDGKEFAAIGQSGPPDEIAGLLNLGPENFQSQHALPYWLFDTAGEVARELNKIVNLDLIDRTQANLASALRKQKAAVEVTEQRLEAARERRGRLAWTEEAEADLAAAEQAESAWRQIAQDRVGLETLLSEAERLAGLAETAEGAVSAGETALSAAERHFAAIERREGLETLLAEIAAARDRLAEAERDLAAAEAELAGRMGGLCPLCGQGLP